MRSSIVSLTSVLVLLAAIAHAQNVFSDQQAAELIRLAHQNFWGKAKLSTGQVIQPRDERERQTLPIPYADAVRVVQSSVPAGLGAWCSVDWRSYYQAFMKLERQKPWSEKQIAFICILFGVAQGNLQKAMSKSPCTPKEREGVTKLLAIAKKRL